GLESRLQPSLQDALLQAGGNTQKRKGRFRRLLQITGLRRRCAGKHKPVSLKFTRLKATLLSLSANFANPSIPSLWLGTAFRTKNSVYRFCPVPFDFNTPMSISLLSIIGPWMSWVS